MAVKIPMEEITSVLLADGQWHGVNGGTFTIELGVLTSKEGNDIPFEGVWFRFQDLEHLDYKTGPIASLLAVRHD